MTNQIKFKVLQGVIKAGDIVEVYVPVGEPPYPREILKVLKVDKDEGLAYLEDNTSVGIGYCTKVEPLQAINANKEVETVEEAAVKWFMANHGIASPNSAFKAGAHWQQSQSVESIVGFVLEYFIQHKDEVLSYYENDEEFEYGIRSFKADIIKELNTKK